MVAIMNGIYNIRMKYISPFDQITVGVNTFHAGTKGNVIPDTAKIEGSARVFTQEVAEKFHNALTQICKSCGEMYGCEVEVAPMRKGGPRPVVNNPQCAALARSAVAKHMGDSAVGTTLPAMGSESFSLYGLFAPAVFGNLGVATPEKGSGAEIHNQYFDIDEECLKIGVGAHVSYAVEYLKSDIQPEFTRYEGTVKSLFE